MSAVEIDDAGADGGGGAQQPATRRLGRRTLLIADVDPLDVDGVRTVEVGTAAWLVAFVALLPFYGRLEAAGEAWWLWTCLAGFGFGLLGLEYCRRRRKRHAELRRADKMLLVIAPEGTRQPTQDWRLGFYRIALAAGVPIVPAGPDYGRKVAIFGPPIMPTGVKSLIASYGILRVAGLVPCVAT